MREALRKRYYCDYCNKAGGSRYHMANHERGCTLNPDRLCGVCLAMKLDAAPLAELIAFVQSVHEKYVCPITSTFHFDIVKEDVVTLRDRAGNCPACVLAALRQTKTFTASDDFDFRAELKSMWADHEREQRNYG